MRIKNTLRDFLVSLTLANLIMMKVWLSILPFKADQAFFLEHSQGVVYVATLMSTLIISVALWSIMSIATRWQKFEKGIWLCIYVTTIVFCLNGIRAGNNYSLELIYSILGMWGTVIVGLLLVVGAGYLIFRYRDVFVQKYSSRVLILSPFLVFTFGQSLLALSKVEPESAFSTHAYKNLQPVERPNAIPVVWIIFDELDYRIAFGHRPKNLLLPELDKLQLTSLSASKAYSPGGATIISIPELLTGKVLKSSTPLSANRIELIGLNGKASNFPTDETIIGDLQKRGEKTAIFGWYFPYNRLLATVDVIKSYPYELTKTIFTQLSNLIESRFTFLLSNSHHISITKSMQNDVIHFLQTFESGFVFLHYPVPHADYIYNRNTKTYCQNLNLKEGYIDNVALTDRLLGEVRATMEQTGTWDKSLLIVSADHHWRFNTYDGVTDTLHVPFLVKLPRQKYSLSASDRFETVNTKEMILNIIDGKINTPEEVKRWIKNIPSIMQ